MSWATPLPSAKVRCDPYSYDHERPSRADCAEAHRTSPYETARVYLPHPERRFLANAYSRALQKKQLTAETAALIATPVDVRMAVLPVLGEKRIRTSFWEDVDMARIFAVLLTALILAGIVALVQVRRLLAKLHPMARNYSRREDLSVTSAFSQAFTKRFWISAPRSLFDWASKLFHKPNSAQPLPGLRRKSSQ